MNELLRDLEDILDEINSKIYKYVSAKKEVPSVLYSIRSFTLENIESLIKEDDHE